MLTAEISAVNSSLCFMSQSWMHPRVSEIGTSKQALYLAKENQWKSTPSGTMVIVKIKEKHRFKKEGHGAFKLLA